MNTKSITIHGISKELDDKIHKKSKELHLSQNKTIKKMLEGYEDPDPIEVRKKEFAVFLGVWTKEEAAEFEKLVEDEERIDPEDWQ